MMYLLFLLAYTLLLYHIIIVNPLLACYLFTKLILYIGLIYMFMYVYKYIDTTLNRLKPNLMIHINIMCTRIGELSN